MVWHYAYVKSLLAVVLGSTFDHAAYLAELELKRRAKEGSAHRGPSHALV